MIWMLVWLVIVIYAMYVIGKFADDINPYNWMK